MVVLPSGLSYAKNSTVLAGSALPVKLGVASLVWLSKGELPLSEADLNPVEGAAMGGYWLIAIFESPLKSLLKVVPIQDR